MSDHHRYYTKSTPIEENISKVDYYRKIDDKYNSTSYRLTMKRRGLGINCSRYFKTIEEARNYKVLILQISNKANLSKDIESGYINKNNPDEEVLDWPDNLLKCVGITPKQYKNYYDDIIPNFDERFEEFKNILNQRELVVIKNRFKDYLSLEQIGKVFEVTRERIRQIEAKAIRKIAARKYILVNKKKKMEVIKQDDVDDIREQIRLNLTIEEAIKIVNELNTGLYTKDEKGNYHRTNFLDTPLQNLNLSARTYNALAKTNSRTVRDVLRKYPTQQDMRKIRSLGQKSLIEFINLLTENNVFVLPYSTWNDGEIWD